MQEQLPNLLRYIAQKHLRSYRAPNRSYRIAALCSLNPTKRDTGLTVCKADT